MRRFIALIIAVFVAISVNGVIAQSIKETKGDSHKLNCEKSAREYLEFAESAYDEGQHVKRKSIASDTYLNAVFTRGILAAHLYRICSELEQQNQKSMKPSKK